MKVAYAVFCAPLVVAVIQWANNPLQFIVLLGAAAAAISVLWGKVVKPMIDFGVSVTGAVENVRGIHAFQEEVLTRLEVIEGALYGTDHMESLPIRRRNDPTRSR